jgi:hypothetical protein
MVGHIKQQLQFATEIIHQLEIARDSRLLSPQEEWLRCQLKRQALGLSSLERTMARLRSRLSWKKLGDANTSYLHHHAHYRRRKNFMARIKVGDQIIIEQEEKLEAVWNFYNDLLGTAGQRDLTLDLEVVHRTGMDLHQLEQVITKDEVWAVIKTLPSDKAPVRMGVLWSVLQAGVANNQSGFHDGSGLGHARRCQQALSQLSMHHSHTKDDRSVGSERLPLHKSGTQLS